MRICNLDVVIFLLQILPIDFPSVLISQKERDVVKHAFNVMELLLEFMAHHCRHHIPMFLNLFLHSAQLPPGSMLSCTGSVLSSQLSCMETRLPCTYLTVLAGHITKSPLGPRGVIESEVTILILQVFCNMLNCPIDLYAGYDNQNKFMPYSLFNSLCSFSFPLHVHIRFLDAPVSLLSAIGLENMCQLAETLLDILNTDTELEILRSLVLDLFIFLAASHQNTLVYLIEELPNFDVHVHCEEACRELGYSQQQKDEIYETGSFDQKLVEVIRIFFSL